MRGWVPALCALTVVGCGRFGFRPSEQLRRDDATAVDAVRDSRAERRSDGAGLDGRGQNDMGSGGDASNDLAGPTEIRIFDGGGTLGESDVDDYFLVLLGHYDMSFSVTLTPAQGATFTLEVLDGASAVLGSSKDPSGLPRIVESHAKGNIIVHVRRESGAGPYKLAVVPGCVNGSSWVTYDVTINHSPSGGPPLSGTVNLTGLVACGCGSTILASGPPIVGIKVAQKPPLAPPFDVTAPLPAPPGAAASFYSLSVDTTKYANGTGYSLWISAGQCWNASTSQGAGLQMTFGTVTIQN